MPRDTVEKLNTKSVRESDADKLIVAFSESHGHQGKVQNLKLTWPRFCDRVSTPRIDNLTFKQYKALPISEQHKRKNQGYFVGGQFDGGIRKVGKIKERTLLTFDIDRCTKAMLDELTDPFSSVFTEYDYLVHSTRNHTDDEPRVRVVVPLAAPLDVKKFAPLQRIIAWHLDNAMETVDPISFRPAQIMYWPSVCRGAPYIAHRNRGRLMDGEAILAAWGDWKDYHKLPTSPRETKARQAMDKVQDPRTKHGVIGAFCRAHDIYSVIENFIPGVYVPGDSEDRLTFVDGSTANGAVVYDEGQALYSHHGTDPCSGRLTNAFDLSRIHKFGHLDKAEHLEDDDVTSLPSYKEMVKFAQADELTKEELAKDHLPDEEYIADFDAEDAPEVTTPWTDTIAPARERTPASGKSEVTTQETEVTTLDTEWHKKLEKNRDGIILSSLPNIRLVLSHDARVKGSLAYNELQNQPVLLRRIRSKQFSDAIVRNKIQGDDLTEDVYVTIRLILETPPAYGGYGMTVKERDLKDGIHAVVMNNRFHPVQKYLRSLVWDGIPRIRNYFQTYFHAEDRPIYSTFSFNFLVGAVMRAFEAGGKFDFVPILQGEQGSGKSSGIRITAGDAFFGELSADFSKSEKVLEQMQGRWIVEIPELSQFQRGEVETIKAVISSQEDRARLAYLRGARNYKRQTMMIGTTNRATFLKDQTGNRRFWPVVLIKGTRVEFAKLLRDRDQLWAEAFHEYLYLRLEHDGALPLYIKADQIDAVQAAQAEHTEIDEHQLLANRIQEWIEKEVSEEEAGYYFRGSDIEDGEVDSGEKVKRDAVILDDIAFHVLGITEGWDARKNKALPKALELVPGWHRSTPVQVPGVGFRTIYRRNRI